MKVEELILAKCINNKDTSLEEEKYYKVEEIHIGQSNSSVLINGTCYNSIKFEYYDDKLEKFNIYHSKYSPYHKIIKKDRGIEKIDTNIPCAYEIETTLRDKLNEVIDELNKVVNRLNKGE